MTSFLNKTVAVMLCTYNGERFLDAQLRSLAQQTVPNLTVFVCDDGSTDATLDIIERSKIQFPYLNIQFLPSSHKGSRKRFQHNFLSIFNFPQPPADYIAYADQDDIWESDKLERAIKQLEKLPPGHAGLYGSRMRLIDEEDKEIGFSFLFKKKLSFANALVQSTFCGNTLVMNEAAWHLMHQVNSQEIVSHDWWTYQVICGAGGSVFYDPIPGIRYRQHLNNDVGAGISFKARAQRIKLLLKGRLQWQNEINTAALLNISTLLTQENQQILTRFVKARKSSIFKRLYYFKASGVYCQTRLGMMGLWLVAVLGKI
jgi:glycosyltransferase involved in cell wall biosynthesis